MRRGSFLRVLWHRFTHLRGDKHYMTAIKINEEYIYFCDCGFDEPKRVYADSKP